jgi:3'-5' exoribonuclease 1
MYRSPCDFYGISPQRFFDSSFDSLSAYPQTYPQVSLCPADIVLVVDFEATCQCQESTSEWPYEIIEFPAVAIDVSRMAVFSEFHSFVRPTRNPTLTPFCKELTGIRQSQIDSAPPLVEVLRRFEAWYTRTIPPAARVIVATDGPWDMREFMHKCSVQRDGVVFPRLFYRWIDVKESFASFFGCSFANIATMLDYLALGPFQGRMHSGLDDARNVARIFLALLERRCRFEGHIHQITPQSRGAPTSPLMLPVPTKPIRSAGSESGESDGGHPLSEIHEPPPDVVGIRKCSPQRTT